MVIWDLFGYWVYHIQEECIGCGKPKNTCGFQCAIFGVVGFTTFYTATFDHGTFGIQILEERHGLRFTGLTAQRFGGELQAMARRAQQLLHWLFADNKILHIYIYIGILYIHINIYIYIYTYVSVNVKWIHIVMCL